MNPIYPALAAAVRPKFGPDLVPVQPGGIGGFAYYYSNAQGQLNQWAYDAISPVVQPGRQGSTAVLDSPGGFAFGYLRLLTQIAFQLSAADRQTLTLAADNSVAEANAVVQAWTGNFGAVTAAQLQEAAALLGHPLGPLDFVIEYEVGSLWSGQNPPLTYVEISNAPNLPSLLPNMPANGGPVLAAVAVYIAAAEPGLAILDALNRGNWMLGQIRTNLSLNQSAGAAAVELFDPTGLAANQWAPGYTIGKTVPEIVSELRGSETIAISLEATRTGARQYSISVDGGAPFPFTGPLLGADASAIEDAVFRGQATRTVTLTYRGLSLVPISPQAWAEAPAGAPQPSVGWYGPAIIADAWSNTLSPDPPSGFVFASQPVFDLRPFPAGGFSRLRSLLIANYPELAIGGSGNLVPSRVFGASGSSARPRIRLFGEIPVGGPPSAPRLLASEAAAAESPGVPTYQQTACVLAGSIESPGVLASPQAAALPIR